MFAEMTPGSNHSLSVSRRGIERNLCMLYGKQRRKSRTKDQKNPKSPSCRNNLKFCFKDHVRMEPQEAHKDSYAELSEGRLKELALKWFLESQVPLIVHDGLFPTWFQGFITRKDAEEILREKELGCFLVRLSDKAIGYILSYRGRDRCRHFVINQSERGQFVVCGDSEGHDTVHDLIEYYRTNQFEPFGEYLTSSCFQVNNEDLYDTIQISPKAKPVAAVNAVKNVRKQQTNLASEQTPRTQPPKSNRTEEVPPLPQRSRHLDSGLPHDQDGVLYAHLMKQSPGETQRHISQGHSTGRPPSSAGSAYSDGGQHHRRSPSPHTAPRLSPQPVRQAASSLSRSEMTDSSGAPAGADYAADGAIYHLAGRPGSQLPTPPESSTPGTEQARHSVYAEVAHEAQKPTGRFFQDNTYELIPGHPDSLHRQAKSNTYELLQDVRPKGLKNDKWKWLFPEAKRKW